MIQYIVHLYREMRLSYTGIEAETPQAAAYIASGKPTADADNIEDCEGENLSALVEVAGDEDHSQSVSVDFEPERQRQAASRLLAALTYALEFLKANDDGGQDVSARIAAGEAAVAEAKAAEVTPGICTGSPPARFEFTHEPEENPDRAFVLVDGRFDVAIIRTDEGIVIDVYPKDWIDPIDSLTIWDEEVAEALASANDDDAGGGIVMDAIETTTIEQDGQTFRITVYADPDASNPLEDWDEMGTILSLNRRHVNFDPGRIEEAIDDPDAVKLSYFEHGQCLWSVAGELPAAARCPWDSVRFAGVWLPDAQTLESARNYGGRTRQHFMRKRARQACEVYTQWCNGDIYGYEIAKISTCPCCGAVDSCWGFYGLDACLSEAQAVVPTAA